ncbi:hypothetical protein [Nostoc sp. UHCC 0302]|uniref:hypothetical protein n=1 Tax=Nostoc sp. UHCC 0302 TaxID=3134896 RepID=UPI00311C9644
MSPQGYCHNLLLLGPGVRSWLFYLDAIALVYCHSSSVFLSSDRGRSQISAALEQMVELLVVLVTSLVVWRGFYFTS